MEAARDRAIGDGGPVLSAANDAIASMAQKFPELTGGASLAATALVAAGGVYGLMSASGGGGISGAASRAMPYVMKGGKLFLRGAGGLLVSLGGEALIDSATESGSATNRYSKAALNGAALGGTLGSFVTPVLGTAIGAALGGAGGAAWEWLSGDKSKNQDKRRKISQ